MIIKLNERDPITSFTRHAHEFGRLFLPGIIFVQIVDAFDAVRFVFDATGEKKNGREGDPRSTTTGAGGITPHARESQSRMRDHVKIIASREISMRIQRS